MDIDLLIPLFWTVVFGSLTIFALRKLTQKSPTKKKWIRPDVEDKEQKPEE